MARARRNKPHNPARVHDRRSRDLPRNAEVVAVEVDDPLALEPGEKIVVRHESKPKYRLVITLRPSAGGTAVSWEQTFEDADVASRIEHIVVPANEQNLDRLSAEVMREGDG